MPARLCNALVAALFALVSLTATAQPAAATACFGPISLFIAPPFAAPALVTTIAAGVADYSVGWQISAYIAGSMALVSGLSLTAFSVGRSGDSCSTGGGVAAGTSLMVLGGLSLAMGVFNHSKPRPERGKLVWSYAPWIDLHTQTTGVVVGGQF